MNCEHSYLESQVRGRRWVSYNSSHLSICTTYSIYAVAAPRPLRSSHDLHKDIGCTNLLFVCPAGNVDAYFHRRRNISVLATDAVRSNAVHNFTIITSIIILFPISCPVIATTYRRRMHTASPAPSGTPPPPPRPRPRNTPSILPPCDAFLFLPSSRQRRRQGGKTPIRLQHIMIVYTQHRHKEDRC